MISLQYLTALEQAREKLVHRRYSEVHDAVDLALCERLCTLTHHPTTTTTVQSLEAKIYDSLDRLLVNGQKYDELRHGLQSASPLELAFHKLQLLAEIQQVAPRMQSTSHSRFEFSTTRLMSLPAPKTTVDHTVERGVNKRPTVIPRNAAGQRIDDIGFNVPYRGLEVDILKQRKLCKWHYLSGYCVFSGCPFNHTYIPSQQELDMLIAITREAPCNFGTACAKTGCVFGHRCPYNPQIGGLRSCWYRRWCKFPPEMHVTDTTVVRSVYDQVEDYNVV